MTNTHVRKPEPFEKTLKMRTIKKTRLYKRAVYRREGARTGIVSQN